MFAVSRPGSLHVDRPVFACSERSTVLPPPVFHALRTPHIHLAVDEVSDLVDAALVDHGLHLRFFTTYSNDSVPLLPVP